MKNADTERPRGRRRWLLGMVAVLALLWLATWLALPHLLRQQIEERASAALGRDVRVGEVSVSLWRLAVTLRELSIGGAPGMKEPQLTVQRLLVNASASSLFRRAPVVEALEVDAPRLRLLRRADGSYDLEDILQRLAAPGAAPSSEPARFAVFNVQLRGGAVSFDDQRVGERHELADIRLGLPFLSSLPGDVDVHVEPQLAFTVDGRAVDLRGQLQPFAADRSTELKLRLDRIDLARWWDYLPATSPVRPVGGTLVADLALRFSQPPGAAAKVAFSGKVGLNELTLSTAANAPLLAWRSVDIDLAELRPLERVVMLQSVAIDGLAADLRRTGDGRFEWAVLAGAPATPAPSNAEPWQFGLKHLALKDSRLRWQDDAVRPAAALTLDAFAAELQDLRWPLAADASALQASGVLLNADKPAATLRLRGRFGTGDGAVALEIADGQLAAAAPYVAQALRPALSGRVEGSAELQWAGGDTPRLSLSLTALRVADLQLGEARAPLLQWGALSLEDAQVDLLARSVRAGAIKLAAPRVQLERRADGRWSAEDWLAPQRGSAESPSTGTPPPWRVALAALSIERGHFAFTDRITGDAGPAVLPLTDVRISAQNLEWPGGAAAFPFELALKMPAPPAEAGGAAGTTASVQARGRLALSPLSAQAALQVDRLPAQRFDPYFAELLPVRLQRAELGWRGRIDVQQRGGAWHAAADGDALIANLHLLDRGSTGVAEADELLRWQSLTLRPLKLSLQPGAKPRVEIGEAELSDFFAGLVVTEQGRFNLRDVGGTPRSTGAAASAPAPAASAPAVVDGWPVDLIVGSTRISGGHIDFHDHFIRPNYSADLTELTGSLGRFASGSTEMATLEVRGRAAGTALLEIRGALNPMAKPLALNISARATDLELAPFSPYAGKYAGYAIERGKLSMDVAYRIDPDGKLEAKNQVILNQLTFGDKVESPDATKLPVRLALALLSDRNGVIDIDLPISGSINDPQFSVFGLVLRIIGNLLVKALTAPFSLLAGGGGGPDLSQVEFVPGTAEIDSASAGVIERVAKSLAERPALRMTVTGTADPVGEREAMQAAALQARLRSDQRRERVRAGAAADVPLPPMAPDERARLVRQLYAQTKLPNKPRNVLGLAKDIPLPEMEALLRAAVTITPDSARDLALQRGLAVREALIERGLPSARLFLAAPSVRASGADDAAWTPRVQLSLEAR
jgi:uncharacterized protein involved in outer membrane biogenesis